MNADALTMRMMYWGTFSTCVDSYPYNDRWDSGFYGFIYIQKKNVFKMYGGKKLTKKLENRAYNGMDGVVETLDLWIRGSEYYITVYDSESNEVDSCGGFLVSKIDDKFIYGNMMAKKYIKAKIKEKREKHERENNLNKYCLNSMVLNNL